MKNITKLAVFFFIMTATPAAHAADLGIASVTMPVKARIIRCVTNEERIQMCSEENLCCHLPVTQAASDSGAKKNMSTQIDRNSQNRLSTPDALWKPI